MHTTPSPVPQGHGLYLLIHAKSRSVYVGSSTNLRGRAHEWRRALKRKPGSKPPPPNFPVTPSDEWEFRVVKRTEGMAYEQLRAEETALIERGRKMGMNILNSVTPSLTYRFVVDGIEGSATSHATRLGKNPANVTEKLRRGYTIEQALGRAATGYDPRENTISMMATKIVHNGNYITIAEAAEILNRSKDGLMARLSKLRKRDPSLKEIQLSELDTRLTTL